ncbi:MAG: type II toxin-antitoxin system RelE/ParE family toxin [Rhodanobacter sp.]|nr:MAG: type II toxin-antitoxin system RelE/ParE family toxin [Rhodanobacter sp.]
MNIVLQSDEFKTWLAGLKDQTARAKVLVRVKRLAAGNMGDAKHFDGISEMRIDYGPGYRIYVARKGNALYLLLSGGDKSSQQKDIEKAKKILAASSSPV